jgi:hypothetical protein
MSGKQDPEGVQTSSDRDDTTHGCAPRRAGKGKAEQARRRAMIGELLGRSMPSGMIVARVMSEFGVGERQSRADLAQVRGQWATELKKEEPHLRAQLVYTLERIIFEATADRAWVAATAACRELAKLGGLAMTKVEVSTQGVTAGERELLGALKLTNAQRLAEIDKLEREIVEEERIADQGVEKCVTDQGDDHQGDDHQGDDHQGDDLAVEVAALRAENPGEPVLVVVDYLQATPVPPGSVRGYIANVSMDLRRAAKANRVVLIGVSQASTENSKKLRAGDLLGIESSATGAETAQIERDAYVLLTLADRREVDPDTVAWRLSVAKYRIGQPDMVYELHYRGRIGTWEVLGEPVRAAVVRESRETEGKVKKLAELKRSITQLVLTSSEPLSKNQISEKSTGSSVLKAKAINELLQDGAIVHVKAKRGGAPLIWGPGMEPAAAATRSDEKSH